MFYRLVDERTIEKVSNPLCVNGRHIFTNSEKVFNENGYYKLQTAEYPQDDKLYESNYTLQDNIIIQNWVEVELPEVDEILDNT